ncbi:MAG TPA: glycine--tRNA ligase, partial [Cryomorphaceae bacterium]|nr:glycine--tRNA ligase [Cryomorphaceae bacterium]
LHTDLKFDFQVAYDEKDAIGKRYRRHDAIGTPLCITVDHQSLEDGTVTLRDRDTMEQKRVHRDEVFDIVRTTASLEVLLKKI